MIDTITFWLIERGPNQGQSPHMWCMVPERPVAGARYTWTEDVHKATQFQTPAAAEQAAQEAYVTHYAITSHNFVDASPPGAPAQPPTEPGDAERAAWLADKIVAMGDYAKEAAGMLRRWPAPTEPGAQISEDEWIAIAERVAMLDWNSDKPDGFLNAVKRVGTLVLAAHPASLSPQGDPPPEMTDAEIARIAYQHMTGRAHGDHDFARAIIAENNAAWLARSTSEAPSDVNQLRAFAQGVLEDWPEDAPDGFTLQDLAEKHGLLELADPEPTEPCGEGCHCAEYFSPDEWAAGVQCYRKTPLLTATAPTGAKE